MAAFYSEGVKMPSYKHRNQTAAKYVEKHFPNADRVADVGAGVDYLLTKALRERGYDAHAFDPTIHAEEEFTHRREFSLKDAENFDVLVGVWACEAEELLLKVGLHYKKPLILLLCECHPGYKNFGDKYWYFTRRMLDYYRGRVEFSREVDRFGFPLAIIGGVKSG